MEVGVRVECGIVCVGMVEWNREWPVVQVVWGKREWM